MLPALVKLGPVTIYSYGVFLFLAFFFGMFVVWKRGREEHFDDDDLFDVTLYSSLWALVGARVVYGLFNLDKFGVDIFSWLNILGKPGLSSWGALIGGLGGLAWFAKKKKWDFFEIADVMVAGVAMAQIFGWIGSFLNGSGYGKATDLPIGVTFPGLFDKRHPAQLYAVVLYILLFWWLWWVESKYRTFEWYKGNKTEANTGFLLFSYLLGLGLISLILVLVAPGFFYWGRVDVRVMFGVVIAGIGLVGGYIRSGRKLGDDLRLFSRAKVSVKVPRFRKKEKQTKRRENNEKRVKLGDDII